MGMIRRFGNLYFFFTGIQNHAKLSAFFSRPADFILKNIFFLFFRPKNISNSLNVWNSNKENSDVNAIKKIFSGF